MSLVLSHPMVHPWATIVDGEDSLVVRHANRAVVFRGPGAKALLPTLIEALDGTRTAADIVAQYAEAEQASVRGALDRLAQHNLLVEAAGIQKESTSPTTLRAATALSEALFGSVGIAEIMQRLTQTRIVLLSDLDNASQLEEILRHSGFGCVDRLPLAAAKGIEAILTDDTIVVLAPRRGTAPELAVMNEVALRTGCRWTHVLPYDGSYGVAGPLYLPGETGCYRCFQIRRRSTLEALEQQRVVDDSPESVFDSPLAEWTSPGQESAVWGILAHLLSIEALDSDWAPSPLAGHIHTMQWTGISVKVDRHRLYRVPRCPDCGPMDLGVPQPWFEPVEATSVTQGVR